VAVLVRRTNWNENRYETRWRDLRCTRGRAHPLNRTGSILQVEWLDEDTLAALKEDPGKGDSPDAKTQIWLYEGLVGEGWMVTDHKSGVKPSSRLRRFSCTWQPTRSGKRTKPAKTLGKFTHFEQEDAPQRVILHQPGRSIPLPDQARAATEDEAKDLVNGDRAEQTAWNSR